MKKHWFVMALALAGAALPMRSLAGTPAENSKVAQDGIQAIFAAASDDAALAAVDKWIAADGVDHNPMPGMKGDLASLKTFIKMWRAAFPDCKVTIEDTIAAGDKVVVRNSMHCTHKGTWMGMAATGKQFDLEAIDIVTVKDGKMHEHWGQLDIMGMMQQLGAMPGPGAEEGKKP